MGDTHFPTHFRPDHSLQAFRWVVPPSILMHQFEVLFDELCTCHLLFLVLSSTRYFLPSQWWVVYVHYLPFIKLFGLIIEETNMSFSGPQSKRSLSKPLSRKQRSQQPRSLIDNESLAIVASVYGPIETPVASTLEKEIFIERFEKEILKPFQFSLSSTTSSIQSNVRRSGSSSGNDGPKILIKGKLVQATVTKPIKVTEKKKVLTKNALQSRLVVGTNQCTRILEAAIKKSSITGAAIQKDSCEVEKGSPQLVVLARDLYPPTILAHIPFMCQELGIPILLLPGKASLELGKLLGTKKVGVFLFQSAAAITAKLENSNTGDKEKADSNWTKDMQTGNKAIDSFLDFCKSKFVSSTSRKSTIKSTRTKT